MSPNAYVSLDDECQLLCGYDGERSEPVYKWTYKVFEEYTGSAITPSMYEFMANYVHSNISKDQLYEIEADDYCAGDLEDEAVMAYYELPILERIELHNKMIKSLKHEAQIAENKMHAFISAFIDEECPFEPDNPIYDDYNNWLREGKTKCEKKWENLQNLLCEESFWSSGAERGAEDQSLFDPMDE